MADARENFQRYVNLSAQALGRDLVSLLNRAKDLGIAVCPDVDDDGISYSIEWCFGSEMHDLDVEYDPTAGQWTCAEARLLALLEEAAERADAETGGGR